MKDDLKIIKATYYVPEIGLEKGTNVTEELSAEVVGGRLVYNGIYNRIFPDNFPGFVKRLKVEIEYRGKSYPKFYLENDKINLPHDLGLNVDSSGHIALNLEKSAKNNIFINSRVTGGVKIAGSGNRFVNTYIGPFKEKHPTLFSLTSIAAVVGLVTGIMYLAQYVGIIPDSLKTETAANSHLSTTTPNLLDVYKRAFSYDILADRQSFLRKYINSNIYGDGTVKEISSLSEKYILEINMGGYSILCPQERTEDFERSYPLLKGKSVRFFGIFTYSTYFSYGDDKLVIDQCSFERK